MLSEEKFYIVCCYVVINKPCCRLVDCSFILLVDLMFHLFVVATQKHDVVTLF